MQDRYDEFDPFLAPNSPAEDWDQPGAHQGRYRICRVAMTICAIGAGLMVADRVAWVTVYVTFKEELHRFLVSPGWQWGVGSAIPWAFLMGSYMLMTVWSEPHWRRQAGLLFLVSLGGVACWTWQHAKDFGIKLPEEPWLIDNAKMALRWMQLAMIGGLAADMSAHLGNERADEARQRINALAWSGASFLIFLILAQTDWEHPLRPRFVAGRTPIALMLFVGTLATGGLCAFALTCLCLEVGRQCSDLLRELHQAENAAEKTTFPNTRESEWEDPQQQRRRLL